ncbi:WecB/TagA/CpsF family glycosyltransferase [Falsiruegeria mediterranea]|uniref:N-acetylglucosaminyldiphosphoundecaprenol N-acetyl-beta-D-mannosaminyltransferase n=1 Tax=Falsiruegeria mediterranea M17 TaxID=1200281 RepID=A0A2R8C6W5_9RHOB|nr:WecB/TagA/CpsF family glycosyltransferase [Falsiruegeria mediterranea]SPJ28148.1 N-acetylglucosaminyldiphosphoundecaprenol N-acetyl-beta-D-mannosaminyltransferase [Falsiruegeria mediterranea M17]
MQFTFSDQVLRVNYPDRDSLFAAICDHFRAGQGFSLATINLDHLVKLGDDPSFARVYAAQDMIIADGRPIVWLSRLAGRRVELLPGSDMVRPLAKLAAECGVKVALVGSTEVALNDAKRALEEETPGLQVVLCHAPPLGFDPNGDGAAAVLSQLDEADVQLCFLALGAPKQETLALRGRKLAPKVGFASIGAGLDFLGGHQTRAPRPVRALALEWVWRALSNPVRLIPRYARCLAILPGQIIQARRLRNQD